MRKEEERSAIILRFPSKRGRPKQTRPGVDSGTPELIMKRLMGETAEALDLCLERGLINREQHWCGVHLRWLYTLRHGAPSVRAIDPAHLGGTIIKSDEPGWREAREKEYHEAMKVLALSGHAPVLMNLCIYNERPRFLSLNRPVDIKRQKELATTLINIKEGLTALTRHWGRTSKKK